jgi:hypothetical protein
MIRFMAQGNASVMAEMVFTLPEANRWLRGRGPTTNFRAVSFDYSPLVTPMGSGSSLSI